MPWLSCKNFPELQLIGIPCRDPVLQSVNALNNSTFDESLLTATKRMDIMHEESALTHFMRYLKAIKYVIFLIFSILENPSKNLIEMGDLQIHFVIAQCAIWLAVFMAICFGVRWLGKVFF